MGEMTEYVSVETFLKLNQLDIINTQARKYNFLKLYFKITAETRNLPTCRTAL